jgi:hypothetical protein
VHSDAGGGYSPLKHERHEFDYRGHFLGIGRAVKRDLNRLNTEGGEWYKEYARCGRSGIGRYVLVRKVPNDISNVSLHLMYQEAEKMGGRYRVDLKPMPQDENHAITPDLKGYYDYAKEHLRNAHSYKNSEEGSRLFARMCHHSAVDPAKIDTCYIGDTDPIDDVLKNDSADGGGNDARYVDANGAVVDGRRHPDSAVRVERAVFANLPNNAVVPA